MSSERKKVTTRKEDLLMKQVMSMGNLSANGARKRLCGEFIAVGRNREVYELKQDPNYVVKIQRDDSEGDFSNIKEWMIWSEIAYWDDLRKWFAKIIMMNQIGTFLIQERATVGEKKNYPKLLPTFFTDLKIQNYGWIGDRFVCFDYGSCVMLSSGLDPKKMRKPKWWVAEQRVNKKYKK